MCSLFPLQILYRYTYLYKSYNILGTDYYFLKLLKAMLVIINFHAFAVPIES
ncbi:hypothetical protein AN2V17_21180 [Vallitalea sp. AN17-2]|uniref:Uncharacterized protein n=1 Tax=Vallitalea maricola TaxID=3074433 RepID=A0ACB5UK92_9FIRM|nr:hypothetical protein AN2V17_21180 [Vallitalea sp. AN17-2]